ncbi:hypothetical protein LTS16_000350 [Friedmanniomyces endolithicus]|uniref:Uncharacterized protein n=1 Tax=Friedmanniomyces endolithicus TaxID=329885 RepID=A0AAN6J5P5_9PEZI|nr:hypothetical protein LTS00_003303 [Friedmanniomyces endolithicus]KAK0317407.1 hypothetical protein LTR82_011730 [Friedmanniomyces endolithicus]KAK0931381.1 hypothetical protein LTR57_000796 [Friedmanniomyces endolithicus]KAK1015951.1 hypothetical protein LTR54_003680 [Friedmanniomyces endolithicus]KAK1054705.1 hypothetical protein LTS16_000350 [Friedmanniomyces endolithicus]
MSAATGKATIERRRSHGIGGAGNMRKLFVEAIALLVAGLTTSLRSAVDQRRESNSWVRTISGSSRRGSIIDKIFRRDSKTEEKPSTAS